MEPRMSFDVDPQMPLLWVIRDYAGLTGTKYGCGISQCGACTVHCDGVAVRSCSITVQQAASTKKIVTIEGLIKGWKRIHYNWRGRQRMFRNADIARSGQIMQAASLLNQKPQPFR